MIFHEYFPFIFFNPPKALRGLVARRHHLSHQAPRFLPLRRAGRRRGVVERRAQGEAAEAELLQDLRRGKSQRENAWKINVSNAVLNAILDLICHVKCHVK